jgi:hypothetical protein
MVNHTMSLGESPDTDASRLLLLALIDDLERTDPSNAEENAAGRRWADEVIAASD